MKRVLLAATLCALLTAVAAAQQTDAEKPATKEDVEKYLQVMHSREMMTKMIDAMTQPMHQMLHEQYMKDKDKLPPDFEGRMNKIIDDYLKDLPLDEMQQAMVPAYQKHLTKGDVDALVAFYSSPTGQKLIREMPAMTTEAMQAVMPLLQQRVEAMTQRVQQEVAQMMEDSKTKPGEKSQAPPN
jgi:hypothetical protein